MAGRTTTSTQPNVETANRLRRSGAPSRKGAVRAGELAPVGAAPKGSFLSAGGNGSADAPLARIRRALPALTGALRVCAEYVLANTWEVRGLSIYQLAARTGVSTNAVNRFTRRLGYSGYREFSQDLTLEL